MKNVVESNNYIRLPYRIFNDQSITKMTAGKRQRLTPTERSMIGVIFSYSESGRRCKQSYNTLADKFNASHTSIARAISALKDLTLIAQTYGKTSASYVLDTQDLTGGRYIRSEYWFFTHEFTARNGEKRRLLPSERDILSLVYSQKGAKLSASNRKISALLGLSTRTVKVALSSLYQFGLVYRTKTATSRIEESEYTVDGAYIRRLNAIYRKKDKSEKIQEEAQKTEEDARIERERYYSIARSTAENKANANLSRALEDRAFAKARALAINAGQAVARAEAFNLSNVIELQKAYKTAQAIEDVELHRIGLTRADFAPVWACERCSDSGYLPNGRACNCWIHRE